MIPPSVFTIYEYLIVPDTLVNEPLHNMIMALSGLTFVTTGILLIAKFNTGLSQKSKVFGVGLLPVGLLMLAHGVIVEENAAVFLHIISLLTGSLILIQVYSARLNAWWNTNLNSHWLVILAMTLLAHWMVFTPAQSPTMIVDGHYNAFTRISGWVAALLILATAIRIFYHNHRKGGVVPYYLPVLFLILAGHSIIFVLSKPWSASWWLSNLILACGAILAFVYSVTHFERMLKQLKSSLTHSRDTNIRLEESERKYRMTFNNMIDGFARHRLVRDADGKPVDYVFLEVNPAFERLTGIMAENLIGRPVTEALPGTENDPADWIGRYSQVAMTGRNEEFEAYSEFIGKWFRVAAYSMEKEHFTTIFSDITAEKEARILMREERDRLLQAFESMEDGVYMADDQMRIVYVNPTLKSIFGEPGDRTCHQYFFGQNETCAFCRHEDVFKGEVLRWETYYPEQQRYFDVVYSPLISRSGEITEKVAILRDVTERRKELRELRLAKARAEESDRLKSAFLANVSHEIRTPMNGILGFSELLKEPDVTREETISYLNIIDQSGKRLLKSLSDILDLALIESGKMKVSHSLVHLPSLLSEATASLGVEALAKGIKLRVARKSTPDLPMTMICDNHLLFSILTNLLRNGIKFTQKGTVMVGYTLENAFIRFFVKDTGVGIAHDKLEAIFNRFVQEDMRIARNYEGLGLGLSICKSYVEQLNGRIWAESEKGKGSTFYVELPAEPGQKEKGQTP